MRQGSAYSSSSSSSCPSANHAITRHAIKRLLHLACLFMLLLAFASLGRAQDSPGRFEAGVNFSALHNQSNNGFGPGIDGSVNFGRFISLDGSFNWLAARPIPVLNNSLVFSGLFGVKAGKRFERFGIFGKARPGFITTSKTIREFVVQFTPPSAVESQRNGRLTEFAFDVGGVVEYYISSKWTLRYDFGDTLVREEPLTFIVNGQPSILPSPQVTNNFQFSTSLRYRF